MRGKKNLMLCHINLKRILQNFIFKRIEKVHECLRQPFYIDGIAEVQYLKQRKKLKMQ